jgi:membrane protease YdiL (CAAX protease family)
MTNFLDLWEKGNYSTKAVVQSLVLIAFFFIIGNLPAVILMPSHQISTLSQAAEILGFETLFLLEMLPFLCVLVAILLAVRFIHKVSLLTWITARNRISVHRIVFGFLLWGFILVLTTAIQMLVFPGTFQWNYQAGPFFRALLLLVLLLPFQVLAEELLFRSFALQGFTARIKSVPLAILLSGTMFGMMHLGNPEIKEYGTPFIFIYIFFGVFLALITALDGGIELSFGFHLANNLVAGVVVTSDDQALQVPALFKSGSGNLDLYGMLGFIMGLGLFFVLAFRRFNWKFKVLNRNNL